MRGPRVDGIVFRLSKCSVAKKQTLPMADVGNARALAATVVALVLACSVISFVTLKSAHERVVE